MPEETKKNKEEVKKTSDTKNETSKESSISSDQMAINNKQAADIAALQSENLKLKDYIGKKQKPTSAPKKKRAYTSIVGLQGFKGFR